MFCIMLNQIANKIPNFRQIVRSSLIQMQFIKKVSEVSEPPTPTSTSTSTSTT